MNLGAQKPFCILRNLFESRCLCTCAKCHKLVCVCVNIKFSPEQNIKVIFSPHKQESSATNPQILTSCSFLTCYNLSELRVQVDCAGKEGANVSSSQHWSARGEEHLETPHVSIYLQQRFYIFSGGNILGNSVT